MTSFLRLNGLDIPVLNDSAELEQHDIAGATQAIDGSVHFSRRATKEVWSMRTPVKTALEAEAIRGLVSGRGHVLSFEGGNFYTSKGKAPSALGASVSIDDGATALSSTKYGDYALYCGAAAGAAGKIGYVALPHNSPYTIAHWRTTDGGSTWHHYMQDNSTLGTAGGVRKSVDGARSDATTIDWVAVAPSTGVVTFGKTSVAYGFDDIVILPFHVPDAWFLSWAGFGAGWGELPKLKADGYLIRNNVSGGVLVKGTAMKSRYVQGVQTSFQPNLQDVEFSLFEA